MVEPNERVLEALLSWHADQLERGVSADKLPKVPDLRTIASTPGVTRQMLPELPLVDREALMPYATGVMTAVRTTLRELAAEQAAAPPPAAAPVAPAGQRDSTPDTPRAARSRSAASNRTAAKDADASGGTSTPAPAASPRTQTARPRTTAAAAPTATPATSGSFARYDLATPKPPFVLSPGLKPQPDGRLWIGWQPPQNVAPHVIYRVVSRDDVAPWTPDEADVIGVTSGSEIYDARPLPAAVRHIQVWAHAGQDEADARSAQPLLLRAGTVIAPPSDVEWAEDHGTVIVSWRVAPGVHEVELRRVPVEEASSDVFSSASVLLRDSSRISYQDTSCLAGKAYEYRLFSVIADAASGQEQMSEPARFRVQVTSSLSPVTELRLAERSENGRTVVDLDWDQPPGADVRIYRTEESPDNNARQSDIDISALPTAGLADSDRHKVPPTVTDGIGRVDGITWPDHWPRVHFTAVSISGSTARVGDTATRSRTTAITDERLVQRVTWQLLTFSWPKGTVSVDVHVTPPGTTLEEYAGAPVKTLLETEYRRDGGTRLELPWSGCEVHLVPVSFYDKQPVKGKTTTLAYGGLLALSYDLPAVEPPQTGNRFGGARPEAAPSTLRSIEVQRVSPPADSSGPAGVAVMFTLVARRDRLPLSVSDAEITIGSMSITVPTEGQPGWMPLGDRIDLSGLRGHYVRLLAQLEPGTAFDVALLDPPLATLRPA